MIAIILALITKEVLFSLIAGVLSGTIIYSIASGMNPIVGPVSTVFDVMIQKADMNIIIFCFLLGGLVYLINASGGAQAYGKWASKIIRTKRSSLLLTSLLGCLIFLDDYFNCLTVGTVMKPITDRHHVSRAKLLTLLMQQLHPSVSSHLYQVGQLLSVVILKIQVLLTLNLKPLLRLFHTIFTPFLAFLWFFSSVSFPWILVLWQNRR